MRKLLLLILIIITTSTNVFAANYKNSWYIKLDVGGSWLQALNLREVYNKKNFKIKNQSGLMAIIGVGYYITDNFRTDLTFETAPGAKFVTNFKVENDNNVHISNIAETLNALMVNTYCDLYDFGIASFFIGGGAGISQQKHTLKVNVTHINVEQNGYVVNRIKSTKLKTGFAYQLTSGVSVPVGENIIAEIAYRWRDYGERPSSTDVVSGYVRGHSGLLGIRFSF